MILLTDVTHPFFKINELQFSEFATVIDSSERLRNISYLHQFIGCLLYC